MLKQWVGKLKDKLNEKIGEEVDLLKFYNCTVDTFLFSPRPRSLQY